MRIGVIDLGTNSVRFDVHQIGPDGELTRLHREKLMIRLGQGAFVTGKLDPDAVRRTLHAFLRFNRVAKHLRTEKVVAFATAALREASDRERFVQLIRKRTGIGLRVISGTEEAKLIALGVLSNEKPAVSKGKTALVDIGGGSTEISICKGRKVNHCESFPLGTARLQQVFLRKSPPNADNIQDLREYIRNTLGPKMSQERWPKVPKILGSSGTIKAVSKLLRKRSKKSSAKATIERDKLRQLISKLSAMNVSQLLTVPGMEPKRADMILAGAVLLDEVMKATGAKKVSVTEFSLRDGILEEELKLFAQGKTSHLSLHLNDLCRLAERFGRKPQHLREVLRLSEALFLQLRSVHGLRSNWQVYLSAAAILRNVGEQISLAGYPRHSAYIVRNADLPPMEEWEMELIATLCEFHKGGKMTGPEPAFLKDKTRAQAFTKLLALLRILDALDSGPDAHAQLRSARITRAKVQLAISGSRMTGLESMNLDQKTGLFRKVFKKDIELAD